MTTFGEDFQSGIETVAKIVNRYRNITGMYQDTSLVDVTKICRVEPLCVVSRDIVNHEIMPDVLQTDLNQVSAYYLQAIALQAQVKDVRIMKILDKLNPDRDFSTVLLSTESIYENSETTKAAFKYRLPTLSNKISVEELNSGSKVEEADLKASQYELDLLISAIKETAKDLNSNGSIGKIITGMEDELNKINGMLEKQKNLESAILNKLSDPNISEADASRLLKDIEAVRSRQGDLIMDYNIQADRLIAATGVKNEKTKELLKLKEDLNAKFNQHKEIARQYDEEKSKIRTIKYDSKPIQEANNLAVGKILDVNINVDGKSMQIPVRVTIAPVTTGNNTIVHILGKSRESNTVTERIHAFRSGAIGIADLMLCVDLIDEHRKALINDKTDIMGEITRRANRAKGIGLLTNNPSLSSASTLFVISSNVARELEMKLGGRLENPRIRDKMFDGTYAMIVTVIDTENERVITHTRGISVSSDCSFKAIRNNKSSKGPDIGDMMKSMLKGNAPSF